MLCFKRTNSVPDSFVKCVSNVILGFTKGSWFFCCFVHVYKTLTIQPLFKSTNSTQWRQNLMLHPHHFVTQGVPHCQGRQERCLFACQPKNGTTHGFQLLLDLGTAHRLDPTFEEQSSFGWRGLGEVLMTNLATQKRQHQLKLWSKDC